MRAFQPNAKTKATVCFEPFDDAGDIQVVPIDTIVGDGGHDPEADNASRNQAYGARGSKGRDTSTCSRQRWREPDIVA